MLYKLGRRPAIFNARTQRSAIVLVDHLSSLGTPPPSSFDFTTPVEKVVGGPNNWGLLGNDTYGCCVEADDGHYLMLRTANAGKLIVPTVNNVLDLYTAETGFDPNDPATDQGTYETSDCVFMVTNGLLGHKADATASVDYTNLDHIRWCIQMFGACRFGLNLPQSAMDQFTAGQQWSFVPNSPIIGGHDVPAVRYYANNTFDVITWGRRINVNANFLAVSAGLLEEAHVMIFADWIKSTGLTPSGFNLPQLLADLPVATGTTSSEKIVIKFTEGKKVFPANTKLGNVIVTLVGQSNAFVQTVFPNISSVTFANLASDTWTYIIQQQDINGSPVGNAITGTIST